MFTDYNKYISIFLFHFYIKVLDLSYCKNITDASVLGYVHTLNLCGCNITDVSALGNVHDLDLSCCKNITDVSMLENVHILELSDCEN
jgi:hypothetical protein